MKKALLILSTSLLSLALCGQVQLPIKEGAQTITHGYFTLEQDASVWKFSRQVRDTGVIKMYSKTGVVITATGYMYYDIYTCNCWVANVDQNKNLSADTQKTEYKVPAKLISTGGKVYDLKKYYQFIPKRELY